MTNYHPSCLFTTNLAVGMTLQQSANLPLTAHLAFYHEP